MIRTIKRELLVSTLRDALISACSAPPEEVITALEQARRCEEGVAAEVLRQLAENHRLGQKTGRPCCQDTGMALIFADIGQDVHMDFDFYDAVDAAVRAAYGEGYLRKSVRDPVTGENTGDNTPAIVHVRLTPGDRIAMHVMPKGFGAENQSRTAMLVPADGLAGVEAFVLETLRAGAASACTPVIVGMGIGGDLESCALLAKRQLLRPLGTPSENAVLAEMETRLLAQINALGVGPGGLGGHTTALAVHAAAAPTHIGALPVAVNLQCNAARRTEVVL